MKTHPETQLLFIRLGGGFDLLQFVPGDGLVSTDTDRVVGSVENGHERGMCAREDLEKAHVKISQILRASVYEERGMDEANVCQRCDVGKGTHWSCLEKSSAASSSSQLSSQRCSLPPFAADPVVCSASSWGQSGRVVSLDVWMGVADRLCTFDGEVFEFVVFLKHLGLGLRLLCGLFVLS